MKKRILVTCTDSMMMQFMIPHIKNLNDEGFKVEIACSDVRGRMNEVRNSFTGIYSIKIYKIDLNRNPFKLSNFRGYRQIKKIIDRGKYDLIWTNEPVMGIITRLASIRQRKVHNLKVMYMAHGFHFFEGAPKGNWLIYYSLEKMFSAVTDILVTINKEDYDLSCKKLKAKKTLYLPGIGMNIEKFANAKVNKHNKFKELGLPEKAIVILSVGELESRKNYTTSIKAFAKLNIANTYFLIAGVGSKEKELKKMCTELKIDDRVLFLGYRNDVMELCKVSDIFLFLSLQEGLPVALMEAMAAGLPAVASRIRGNTDEIDEEKGGFLVDPTDYVSAAKALNVLCEDEQLRKKYGEYNRHNVNRFELSNIEHQITDIIKQSLEM